MRWSTQSWLHMDEKEVGVEEDEAEIHLQIHL
jgi:hypothetical protein